MYDCRLYLPSPSALGSCFTCFILFHFAHTYSSHDTEITFQCLHTDSKGNIKLNEKLIFCSLIFDTVVDLFWYNLDNHTKVSISVALRKHKPC